MQNARLQGHLYFATRGSFFQKLLDNLTTMLDSVNEEIQVALPRLLLDALRSIVWWIRNRKMWQDERMKSVSSDKVPRFLEKELVQPLGPHQL